MQRRTPVRRFDRWRRPLVAALPGWLVARGIVLASLALARYLVDHLGTARPIVRSTARSGLLSWDAAYYVDIARHGYGSSRQVLRFFPLVPLIARVGDSVGIDPRVGLLILSNLSALLAGALLYKLARNEGRGHQLASSAAWLLALAPPAFVLVFGYSDATFVLLVVSAFLLSRRRSWLGTAGVALLAGLARPSGFLLAVPIAVEALRGLSSATTGERCRRLAAVLAAPAGTAIYLGWAGARYGDPLLPYRVQTEAHLHGSFQSPVRTIRHALDGLFGGNAIGTGLHVPWILIAVALVAVCFRYWPASYGAFAAVSVASAVVSSNLDSFERYALLTAPLVLAVATITAKAEIQRAVLVLSGFAMGSYALLAFVHAYVP